MLIDAAPEPPRGNLPAGRTASTLVLFALFAPGAFACNVAAGSLAFGAIDPLAGFDTDSSSSITVSCAVPTPYVISISTGQSGRLQRKMTSGVALLDYQLYADPSRASVWGDGAGGSITVNGSADAAGTSHTVHGRVPEQRQAAPGMYIDTLVVTVTF